MKRNNSIQDNNMYFEYIITKNCINGSFSIMNDKSLLYSTKGGDFSILLNGDWRFELNIDSHTGKCINFQGLLLGSIVNANLNIPQRNKGCLFFRKNEELLSGTGCHYLMMDENVYYDSIKKVLCIGNPFSNGVAIEFAEKIIAIICNGCLTAIYVDLKDAYME